MMSRLKIFKLLLITVTCFLVFGFIIYPLLQLFPQSRSQSFAALFSQKQILSACFNSFLLAVITVAGSAVIGTYFAYSFYFKKIRLRRFLSVIVLLPIAIPPIVGVMAYLFLAGENGLLMKLTGLKHFYLSGWTAIIFIHLYSFYPLFYLFAGNALKTVDNNIIEASRILGAGKNRTFFRIILPQLKPALLGASLLTFMASMASFSAPFIFGGSQRFLTTEIYYAKINGDTSLSALLSLLLAAISIAALFLFRLYSKQIPATRQTKGAAKKINAGDNKNYNYQATVISILFAAIIILPIVSLIVISLSPDSALMNPGFDQNISFKNYSELFTNADFLQPFMNSLSTSLIAVALSILAGLSIAHIIRGKKNIFKTLLEALSSIPYGLPGTVIAICLILSFNVPTIFTFNTVLVGTFGILPLAYTIRNLPVMTQAVKAGLHAVDSSAEEASASLGAGSFKTWRSVTLPSIYANITEGALLVFISSFGEFVATVLLYNYSTKTIPIEIYAQMRLFNNGTASAYGVVLFLIVLLVIFLSRRISNKKYA